MGTCSTRSAGNPPAHQTIAEEAAGREEPLDRSGEPLAQLVGALGGEGREGRGLLGPGHGHRAILHPPLAADPTIPSLGDPAQVHAGHTSNTGDETSRTGRTGGLTPWIRGKAGTTALEVDGLAQTAIRMDELSEARTLEPEVVAGHGGGRPEGASSLHHPDSQVEQVLRMDHVRLEALEQLAEALVDHGMVPGLAEVLVQEVLGELVNGQAFELPGGPGEVGPGHVLLGGRHVHLVPQRAQPASQLCGVELGSSPVPGRKAVGHEEDAHGLVGV